MGRGAFDFPPSDSRSARNLLAEIPVQALGLEFKGARPRAKR